MLGLPSIISLYRNSFNKFLKEFFENVYFHQSVKNFDLDQDHFFVCPDLCPNCLQRLLADNKSHH